ncbi:Ribonuclease H-like protein [Daldinia childiae]|uniref:Ribonuclease H-like protein n=1 Tax=Daldinia childiae TaxID=326645 RepID=UPI001446E699|nr:Ribonuclease H-like protein [Daldinia childiae]KAF3061919.1 Ribonuclease H-like protein [Daldinia childiae]
MAKSLFRNGLRGEPKKWYRNIAVDRRADWPQLQEAFRRRFPWRASSDNAQLTAKIDEFERQTNEKLSTYVRRATELADQTDDNQNRVLRDRLYTKMCTGGNENDRRVQERVADRLHAANKTDDIGKLTAACTFDDVRRAIMQCAAIPGKEGDFFAEVETGAQHSMPMTGDDAIREIGLAFRAMRERTEHPTPAQFFSPPPSYGGQTPYAMPTTMPARYGPYAQPQQQLSTTNMPPVMAAGKVNGYDGRRTTFNTGPVQAGPSQVGPTYNGPNGHSSRECDKPQRPWNDQRLVMDAVFRGDPVPKDIKFDLPPQPNQAEGMGVEARRTVPVRTGRVLIKGTDDMVGGMMIDETEDNEVFKMFDEDGGYPFTMAAEKRKAEVMAGGSERVIELDEGGDVRMSTTPDHDQTRPGKGKGRRTDSPHPRKMGMDIPSKEELARRLREVKAQMQQRKQDTVKKTKGDTIPIRAYEDHEDERIDIGELLRITPFPNITWGQFLDRSPTLRAQLARQMGVSSRRQKTTLSKLKRDKQGRHEPHSASTRMKTSVAQITFRDRARPDDGQTYMGYIEGEVSGTVTHRCMVDCGSLSELISPACAKARKLELIPVKEECELKMADDSTTPIHHYVMFPFVVGGILSIMRAYVVGMDESYDILLGKGWLRRNQAVINFSTDQLTITGINGQSHTVKMRPARTRGPIVVERKLSKYSPPAVEDGSDSSSDDGDLDDDDDVMDSDIDDELTEADLLQEMVDIAEFAVVNSKGNQSHPKN